MPGVTSIPLVSDKIKSRRTNTSREAARVKVGDGRIYAKTIGAEGIWGGEAGEGRNERQVLYSGALVQIAGTKENKHSPIQFGVTAIRKTRDKYRNNLWFVKTNCTTTNPVLVYTVN